MGVQHLPNFAHTAPQKITNKIPNGDTKKDGVRAVVGAGASGGPA